MFSFGREVSDFGSEFRTAKDRLNSTGWEPDRLSVFVRIHERPPFSVVDLGV